MEADLSRYHQIDLRDLWRGRLTLRQIAVRVRWLPADSACALTLDGPGWSTTDYLMGDMLRVWTGEWHPSDPRGKSKKRDVARLNKAKRQARERRQRLGITGSVLRRPVTEALTEAATEPAADGEASELEPGQQPDQHVGGGAESQDGEEQRHHEPSGA